ncbi:MAG TPA: fused MFS/spermidine synthase [Vicinamibacterales bacterium]|nr:fused MFS/spermidine synthase [Vicinamibacterales bacterium]
MGLRRRLFVGAYAASGAAALVYEVAWTRLLTLQLGHTVAAASTVLAAFMGGLAVGAWIAGRAEGRVAATDNPQAHRLRIYAALELLVALVALLLPLALAACVPALAWAYADGSAPVQFALVRVALSLLLLGVPAAAMGATFPFAAAWFAGVPVRGTGLHTGRDPSPGQSPVSLRKQPLSADRVSILHGDPSPAADAGMLYAANTAGAALGAVLAGFWLIPAVGLRGTTAIGMALNAAAATTAWWLSTRPPGAPASADAATPAPRPQPSTRKRASQLRRAPRAPALAAASPPLGCAAAAVSGFVALVYEVSWTRLLALVIGPTTYAFATMAASFITGLTIGSAAGSRIARRASRPGAWLGAMLLLCAVAAAAAAWFAASRLPLIVAGEVTASSASFSRVVWQQAFGVALLLLPMTFALGAAFPLALALASDGRPDLIGRDVARVYAANTLGAIAGALTGGFLLLPRLGLRSTVLCAAIVGALCGAACLGLSAAADLNAGPADPRRKAHTAHNARKADPAAGPQAFRPGRGALIALAAGAAVIGAILALPPWDRALLTSGAYKYAPYLQAQDLATVLRAGRIEYYKEGSAGTVTVRDLAGTRSLAIDGKVDASNAGDMLTQRLLGLLPVLLHKHPEEICVIGLGSGVTLGSALTTGAVRRADVVEISPEVVEASRLFDRENGGALTAPGVRLIVGDGRTHLKLTPRRYDVIVSEPSNPWMAGVAALFTREFFEVARARLKPDGLLCQWAHTYDISSRDLRSIVGTFASVFPQGTMWLIGESDLLLIGTNGDAIAPHLDQLAAAWTQGRAPAALSDVGISGTNAPFALLSMFAAGPDALRQYAGGAPLQTDDRMALEFSAPRGIYGRMQNENGAAIRALVSEKPPPVQQALAHATEASWTTRGRMELQAEAYDSAYESFRRAVSLNARDADALDGLSLAASGARKHDEERAWLQTLAAADPANAPVRVELSRVVASTGGFDEAVAFATAALRITPDDPRAGEQLASVFADAGDAARLGPLADALVARFPAQPDARYYHATSLFLSGRTREAAAEARRLVADDPRHARAFNLLGAACATDGQRDCARAAFEASLRLNPHDASTYVNLGTLLLQSGDPPSAIDCFAQALTVDPTSASARDGLAQARAAFVTP